MRRRTQRADAPLRQRPVPRIVWRLADDATTPVAIEAEQAVITDIRAMRTAGKSYRAIADALNERGVVTKQGRGGWKHSAVARIVGRDV